MRTLFIPTKKKISPDKNILEEIKNLSDGILLAYSIQFREFAEELKKSVSKFKKITGCIQVLGCSSPKIPFGTKLIILVGEGKFHAVSLAYETKLPIYIIENNLLKKIQESDVLQFEKTKKISYTNFLISNNIGILISNKPGQENLSLALKLKSNKLLNPKKVYLFLSNNLNTEEFENFSDVQSWVNTACKRMDLNSPRIINIDDLFLMK